MRINTLFFIIPVILFSCKKSDSKNQPQGSTVIPETSFQIVSVVKTELNAVDINYNITEVATGDFSNIYFEWSTDPDFKNNNANIPLTASTTNQTFIYNLRNLKEFTKYYGRLSATFRNVKSFSSIKQWTTDSLIIIRAGELGISRGFNKGDTTFIHTNMMNASFINNSKVFIGSFECPVVTDNGSGITFSVPVSIPAGKYPFRILSRGMDAIASDSTEVLRGRWRFITSPDIPLNPYGSSSGLMFFGTCNSSQKGYIVGGIYFNGPPVPPPHQDVPEYFVEFDPVSQNWIKKYPANPRYFMNPDCHYYNNSIYVTGATDERIYDPNYGVRSRVLRKMLRLDLATLNWIEMNDLPYQNINNTSGFEYNNEWYVGMGFDSLTGSPSKKFWKYNPSTNQWTPLADYPGAGQQAFPTCFTVGQKSYVFYGALTTGANYYRELWEYDHSLNSWTQLNLPSTAVLPFGEKYQIISYNGKAYFLTAQMVTPAVGGFIFVPVKTCVEWEPSSGVYKQVSFPMEGNVIRNVFKQGNQFYFQSDALGYYQKIPNKTYQFTIE